MIAAIGIDVESIERVTSSIETFGDRFIQRVFTASEVRECGVTSTDKARHLTEIFAAKEAVLKILDVRDIVPSWKDIEVRCVNRRHEIDLYRVGADMGRMRGFEKITVTFSNGAGIVIATALAEINFHRH